MSQKKNEESRRGGHLDYFGKSLGDGKNNEPEVKPLVVSSVAEWYLYLLCTKLESNIYN